MVPEYPTAFAAASRPSRVARPGAALYKFAARRRMPGEERWNCAFPDIGPLRIFELGNDTGGRT